MSLRQFVFAVSARASEATMRRRLTHIWLTTGAVPVAHMVAEPEEIDVPALPPQPSLRLGHRALASQTVHQC